MRLEPDVSLYKHNCLCLTQMCMYTSLCGEKNICSLKGRVYATFSATSVPALVWTDGTATVRAIVAPDNTYVEPAQLGRNAAVRQQSWQGILVSGGPT